MKAVSMIPVTASFRVQGICKRHIYGESHVSNEMLLHSRIVRGSYCRKRKNYQHNIHNELRYIKPLVVLPILIAVSTKSWSRTLIFFDISTTIQKEQYEEDNTPC